MKLVIVINDPVVGLGLLRAASFNGYETDVVARTGCAWLAWTKACGRFSEIDESLIENDLTTVLQDLGYDDSRYFCLAAGEIATKALAEAAHVIRAQTLPTIFSEEALLLGNKAGFADICQNLEIPIPMTWHVTKKEEILQLTTHNNFSFPVIIKAVNMSGSIGIKMAASADEVEALVADSTFNFSPLVVQEYIKGEDICLSFFAQEGGIDLAYGQKVSKFGASFPAYDEFFEHAKLISKSIGYTGAANLDARVDDQGRLYLIECNTRFWASSFLSCLLDIDLIAEAKKFTSDSKPAERYYSDNQQFTLKNACLGLMSLGPLSREKSLRFFRLASMDIRGFLLTKLPITRRAVEQLVISRG